jgi:plastocyanin
MNNESMTRRIWTPSLVALVVLGMFAVAIGFAWLAIPEVLPLLGIAAGMFALAGVAAATRRWTAPIAGVLGAILVLIGSLVQPFTAYHLGRPWTSDFAATLLLLAGGTIAGIAGAAASFQAVSRADRRAWPRPVWGAPLVAGLIGLFVGATVFGAVARGSAPPASDPALAGADAEVFVAEDIAFVEAPEQVPSGELVIELRNDGGLEHDVTIAELGDEVVAVAQAGQAARGTVNLPLGTYTYYCSIPGHRDAGMEGTLTAAA